MRTRAIIATVAASALATSAFAITWDFEATKPDPFAAEKTCKTPQLASWGSYVYDWSSKYDLIFSPQDYPMWVWRCPASGFVSFPSDFEKITEAERPRIAGYLAQTKYRPAADVMNLPDELLQHLEEVYAVRDKDDRFRAYFMRYLAWQNRDKPAADDYRRKAFELHSKMLQTGTLKGDELLETLYILGFYSYKFGQVEQAKAYFARMKDVETIDPETKKPRRGAPYLEGLATEVLAGKADDKVRFRREAQ